MVRAPGHAAPQLSARQAGFLLGLVILVAVVAGFWQEHRRAALETRAAGLNAGIDNLLASLEERSSSLAEHNADPELVAELKRRESEAEDKARVLTLLSGESVGNTDGFSTHLAAFGRRHPEGLWLETIRIAAGGRQLMLTGQTLHASLVPQFLGALQLEPVLAGTAFESFTMMGEDGSAPLYFALATGCPASNEGGESAAGAPTASEPGTAPCVPFEPFEAFETLAEANP